MAFYLLIVQCFALIGLVNLVPEFSIDLFTFAF